MDRINVNGKWYVREEEPKPRYQLGDRLVVISREDASHEFTVAAIYIEPSTREIYYRGAHPDRRRYAEIEVQPAIKHPCHMLPEVQECDHNGGETCRWFQHDAPQWECCAFGEDGREPVLEEIRCHAGYTALRNQWSNHHPACEYRHCIHQQEGKCNRPEPPEITLYGYGFGRCDSFEEEL